MKTYVQVMLKAFDSVRSPKLGIDEPGQYLDRGLLNNSRYYK